MVRLVLKLILFLNIFLRVLINATEIPYNNSIDEAFLEYFNEKEIESIENFAFTPIEALQESRASISRNGESLFEEFDIGECINTNNTNTGNEAPTLPSIFDFVNTSRKIQYYDLSPKTVLPAIPCTKFRVVDQLNALKRDLKEMFLRQYPLHKFSLRAFDIENWPEGIDLLKPKWNKQVIDIIRTKMHEFVFVKRTVKIKSSSEVGFDKMENIEEILDNGMSVTSTHNFLLRRYYEESGDWESHIIKWSLLDRRKIPDRYNDFEINAKTMGFKKFYKNPEIVYNVHFFSMYKHNTRLDERCLCDVKRISKKPRREMEE